MEDTVAQDLVRPVSALDSILGKKFPVLDDGFIRVVDYMGTDSSIVQAARVSYGTGTKHVNEDRGLIRYLLRHRHTTPLEMCEIKLHIRIPMDAWRQFIRHRTANVNEYSTRYSLAIDSAQTTNANMWRSQSTDNKQGSGAYLEEATGELLTRSEANFQKAARELYEERIKLGVAREQARKDLPLSTYTEAYWKCDLHNLLHFLSLRMDKHAQYEIREYANVMGNEIVAKWCPITWDAFQEYRMGGMQLSKTEIEILRFATNADNEVSSNNRMTPVGYLESIGWLEKKEDGSLKPHRERQEFESKLKQLGIKITW